MDGVRFGFASSHKGGQHTNGPDYGTVVAEHEVAGVKVEIQTSRRFGPHEARELESSLISLAVSEIVSGSRPDRA